MTERDRLVDIEVEILNETAAAYRVHTGDKAVWLPKSQVEIEKGRSERLGVLTLPEWLAVEKGLV